MKRKQKIGIFDSGLGGLLIVRHIRQAMPQYDYIYLGDTKNLPYGDKSQKEIYENTKKALEYLFRQNCLLVIVACNTASSEALRKIQQGWLPKSQFKDRKALGVIRPTVESVGRAKNIGLIGTVRTVDSGAYGQELHKINKNIKLLGKATPKLVPMIEEGKFEKKVLENYLAPFKKVDALILGCTHYGLLKKEIKKILGVKVKVIAQEELLPQKLKNYILKHKEIKNKLSKRGEIKILFTKITPSVKVLSKKWFGGNNTPKPVSV